jgi:hypothetical protein
MHGLSEGDRDLIFSGVANCGSYIRYAQSIRMNPEVGIMKADGKNLEQQGGLLLNSCNRRGVQ